LGGGQGKNEKKLRGDERKKRRKSRTLKQKVFQQENWTGGTNQRDSQSKKKKTERMKMMVTDGSRGGQKRDGKNLGFKGKNVNRSNAMGGRKRTALTSDTPKTQPWGGGKGTRKGRI